MHIPTCTHVQYVSAAFELHSGQEVASCPPTRTTGAELLNTNFSIRTITWLSLGRGLRLPRLLLPPCSPLLPYLPVTTRDPDIYKCSSDCPGGGRGSDVMSHHSFSLSQTISADYELGVRASGAVHTLCPAQRIGPDELGDRGCPPPWGCPQGKGYLCLHSKTPFAGQPCGLCRPEEWDGGDVLLHLPTRVTF